MQVFQTAGVPPSEGRIILAIIGSMRNSRPALTKSVMANSNTSLVLLFAITLFVSAGLLFLIEPMIAKMILPSLGGTPAVWNTCMVFFQAGLLAGYAYAHASTGWLSARRQVLLQLLLLLLPFP